jgi:hypothetical protein
VIRRLGRGDVFPAVSRNRSPILAFVELTKPARIAPERMAMRNRRQTRRARAVFGELSELR